MITRPLRERISGRNHVDEKAQGAASGSPLWLVRIAILAALAVLVWINRGYLKPIAMAGLFAATLYPVFLKIEAKVPSRAVRAGLLTTLFAVVFIVPIGIVAFLAADAGVRKFQNLPTDWASTFALDPWMDRLAALLPFPKEDIVRVIEQGGTAVGKSTLGLLQNLVSDLPKLTIDNAVIVIGLYVFLADAHRVLPWLIRVSPLRREKTTLLFDSIGSLSSSVIFATVASGLVQSLLLGLACLILSAPGTLLITMSAFVLSFIPVVGTMPVSAYLIGSSFLNGDWTSVIGFSIAAVIVGLSDNFVRPYVLSGSAKLHPLVGFVAAFGALETIGFYGLFLGPVLAGAVFTLVELVLDKESA
ncbi:MAG: AI-2E family transporter [Bdellovibrionaceae bacterium]|nr:AI-2E family transporter [Pseudobdellovibrionaceae bacterium]